MKIKLKNYQNYNKWDFLIIVAIASLAYGNYELLGAIWPIRIIGAFGLGFVIYRYKWFKNSYYNKWVTFLLFWGLWIVLSLIWTPDKLLGFTYTFHMLSMCGIMMLLFYAVQHSKQPFRSIAWGWILFIIIIFPIARWEIITGEHLSSGSYSDGQVLGGKTRIFAAVTFQNLNSMVLMLTLALPFISLMLLTKANSIKFKFLCLLCLLSAGWILIINASRAGILCLSTCAALLLYYYYKTNKYTGKGTVIAFGVLVGYFVIKNWDSLEFLIQIEERLNGRSSIMEDHVRPMLIRNGLMAFLNTWGIGGGVMSMISLYTHFTHSSIHYAHNLALELLMEYGVIIPIIFFILFYDNLFKIRKNHLFVSNFIFLYALPASFFMFVLDDYYQSRAGIWVYIALLVGISGLPKYKWIKLTDFTTKSNKRISYE